MQSREKVMVAYIMQRYKVFSFFLEYDDGDTKSYGNERFGMRGKMVADR